MSLRAPVAATSARPIRVLMVDDHDLFRVGLATVLADTEDIEVVAQASTGRMAVRLAHELQPDVVVIELRLPDLGGAAATEEILYRNHSARIVALSESTSESDITAAVDAGACGYLLKESAIDDVAAAIRAAARGTAWLSPRVAQALLQRLRCDRVQVSQDVVAQEVLSPRETQVLKLLARGDDNNAIAAELSISRQTAKNHVSKILNKLGVSNRVQAATYAVRRGIT